MIPELPSWHHKRCLSSAGTRIYLSQDDVILILNENSSIPDDNNNRKYKQYAAISKIQRDKGKGAHLARLTRLG